MNLYLIRHWETDFNLENKHDHENQAALTSNGLKRAEIIADIFRDIKIDRIISSPFSRCLDTIAPLAKSKDQKIHENQLLREFYLGPMQGKSWDNVSREYNMLLHDTNAAPQEDCEHMTEVTARVSEFLEDLQSKCSDEINIVICTHSGVILYLLSVIDSVPAKNGLEFLPSNAGITKEDAYIFKKI